MSKVLQTAIIPRSTVAIAATGALPGGTIGFVVETAGLLHLTYADATEDSVPIAAGQQLALNATEIDLDTAGSAIGVHVFVA